MKRIINYLLVSLVVLLLTSCSKNLADLEVPHSSVISADKNATLTESGKLLWYKHNGYLDGTVTWANGGTGKQVGTGWGTFKSVFATSNGTIYGIQNDGKLIWYRHTGYSNGTATWVNGGTGKQVGTGWGTFKSVFATSNGVIYGVQNDGKLIWYRHTGYLDGTATWANGGTGIQVGSGWGTFKSVFATSSGAIYGIQNDGKLIWYRHTGYSNGTVTWANGGTGIQVGTGWSTFKSVFATSSGVIYGVQTDGKLKWYRHTGYSNGTVTWANGGTGIQVGTGWSTFKSVFATSSGAIYGINP